MNSQYLFLCDIDSDSPIKVKVGDEMCYMVADINDNHKIHTVTQRTAERLVTEGRLA